MNMQAVPGSPLAPGSSEHEVFRLPAFYSQAWHLVWEEKLLFSDRIEAWANGPVVPSLYREHRGRFKVDTWPKGSSSKLSAKQAESVDAVLKFYGPKSAHYLSDLTHSEARWREAREGLPPSARSAREITPAVSSITLANASFSNPAANTDNLFFAKATFTPPATCTTVPPAEEPFISSGGLVDSSTHIFGGGGPFTPGEPANTIELGQASLTAPGVGPHTLTLEFDTNCTGSGQTGTITNIELDTAAVG